MSPGARGSAAPAPGGVFGDLPGGRLLLWATMAVMLAAAAIRLPYEFWRLIFDAGQYGAIDLRIVSTFVTDWFSGRPATGTYPPASYVLLWPFQGWLPLPQLRWLWAVSLVPMLFWLIRLLERAAGLEAPLEKRWFRFFALSNYATVIVIGSGQLAIHLLPALLAGILLVHGRDRSATAELGAAALLLLALIKPSLSAPFFWVALFACRARRVVLGVGAAYVGLTLAAMGFRPEDGGTLIRSWLASASAMGSGYANLRDWELPFGLSEHSVALSLGVLAAWGVWVFARRRADLWILLGATAIVARTWTYHRLYDDLLIFIPLVALLRIRREAADEAWVRSVIGALVAACWVGLMGPGTLLQASGSLATLYRTGQAVTWAAMLILLVYEAGRSHRSAGA